MLTYILSAKKLVNVEIFVGNLFKLNIYVILPGFDKTIEILLIQICEIFDGVHASCKCKVFISVHLRQ